MKVYHITEATAIKHNKTHVKAEDVANQAVLRRKSTSQIATMISNQPNIQLPDFFC